MTIDGSSCNCYGLIACWGYLCELIAVKAVWITNSLNGKWHSSKFKCWRCDYRCVYFLVWCVLHSNLPRNYSRFELWINATWIDSWWNGSQYWRNPGFYWENGPWVGHSSFKWRHDCWRRFNINSNDARIDLGTNHDDGWRRRRIIRWLRLDELGWLNCETTIDALIASGIRSINKADIRIATKSIEVASLATSIQLRILKLNQES